MEQHSLKRMGKKDLYEDDGRTIADMSDVERTPLLLPNIGRIRKVRAERKGVDTNEKDPETPRFEPSMDKKERKAYLGGAVSASLLIALIYLGAFAILVVLLLLIWRAF